MPTAASAARRLCAAAAAVVTAASTVALAVPAGATGGARAGAAPTTAAAPAGWKLAFTEEFDGTSLNRSRWATYGSTYGDENGVDWRDDEVLVGGGRLRIRMQRRSSEGKPFTAGGLINLRSQVYGRYEFRAKVPKGKGIDSYATLWPDNGGDANATLIEILAPGPDSAHLTNGFGSGHGGRTVTGDFSDAFHTYTIEWSPSRFRILFDGTVWLSDTRVPKVPKALGFAVSCGDNLTGSPDASTPLPAFFEIDWVRVYTYDRAAAAAAATTTSRPKPTTTKPERPGKAISAVIPKTTADGRAAPTTAPGGGDANAGVALDGEPLAAKGRSGGGTLLLLVALVAVVLAGAWVPLSRRRRREDARGQLPGGGG
jgi:beta-glucanase (GH16 family)